MQQGELVKMDDEHGEMLMPVIDASMHSARYASANLTPDRYAAQRVALEHPLSENGDTPPSIFRFETAYYCPGSDEFLVRYTKRTSNDGFVFMRYIRAIDLLQSSWLGDEVLEMAQFYRLKGV